MGLLDYIKGTASDLQVAVSSQYQSTKSTIGGWLSWGSPTEVATGLGVDFIGPIYEQVLTPAKSDVNAARLLTQAKKDTTGQASGTPECAWYSALNPLSQCNTITKAVTTKTAEITTGVGDFVSSTLTKTLVIVVVVGLIGFFLLSY